MPFLPAPGCQRIGQGSGVAVGDGGFRQFYYLNSFRSIVRYFFCPIVRIV